MSESKSTALTVVEDQTAPTMYPGINRGQLELLKRTYAKGTTDDEFALYMNTAMRLRLDPFAKQIYAVKRWDSATREEVMQTQVAIDGYRAVAEDTGLYGGRQGPFWCGDDGEWKDVWLSEKPPRAAKVLVKKKGIDEPYVGVATYKSYVQKNKDGNPRATWASMPDVMLAKCAEAQALRAAFPKQLSGTHTPDEVGDAEVVVDMTKVATALPSASTAGAPAPAAAAPKAPQTPSDVWPAFAADLAPLVATVPGLAEHVVGVEDVAAWTEKEVEHAIGHLLDSAKDEKACTASLGPWIAVVSKHAGASKTNRVALLKAGFEVAYKTRVKALREEAKAQGGAAS